MDLPAAAPPAANGGTRGRESAARKRDALAGIAGDFTVVVADVNRPPASRGFAAHPDVAAEVDEHWCPGGVVNLGRDVVGGPCLCSCAEVENDSVGEGDLAPQSVPANVVPTRRGRSSCRSVIRSEF